MTPADYCAARGAPPGSSAYYALLYHRPTERRVLAASFAFIEELRRDSLRHADPTPVVTRLQWWLQQLASPEPGPPRHPVLAELQALHTGPGLLAAQLAPTVAAALRDVTGFVTATDAHWLEHGHMLAAGPWQLALAHTGAADPGTVGLLAARCTQVSQLQELAARTALGRSPLPTQYLARHDVALEPGTDWQRDPRVHAAIADAAGSLRHEVAALLDTAAPLPVFCRVLGAIHAAVCTGILRNPARLCRGHVGLTPLRKLWIAWRRRHSPP